MRLRNLVLGVLLACLLLVGNVSPTVFASILSNKTKHLQLNNVLLLNSLNRFLRISYSTEHVSDVSIYHSYTMGQYGFSFVTYHVNSLFLFATVVTNTAGKNHLSIVRFDSSIPASKYSNLLPFDNLESGGTLGHNHQTYFMVGGHVNDPAITTIKVSLNLRDGGAKSIFQLPVSKNRLYFLFSKDAKGTKSVTGYDKNGNVVYKLGR